MIFSVIRKVETIGAANYGQPVLYQRLVYGSYPGASALTTSGVGLVRRRARLHCQPTPTATPRLQVTNLPERGTMPLGGMTYVTEIFTRAHADHAARSLRHHDAPDALFNCVFLTRTGTSCGEADGS